MQNRTRAWTTLAMMTLTAAGGLSVLGLAGAPQAQPAAGDAKAGAVWTVDSVHSNVTYKIRHAGVSNHVGQFYNPTGTINLEAGTMDITVPLSGLSSGNAKRDEHLRSPDFFNAKEFPTITFKATSIKSAGENKFDVTGSMTMLGKSKTVTFPLSVVGKGKGMQGGESMGLESTLTIKRSDFGMDKYVKEGMLGDEITLSVALEAGHK